MSRLEDRVKASIKIQDEEPIAFEPIPQQLPDNPHTLYNEVQTNPIPKGILPEEVGTGHTLDFSCLEKYQIFTQSPRKMRTYMRNEKAMVIENIKGFSKKPRGKFDWKIILIIGGAMGGLLIGLMILQNPDAITNALSGFMPNL